MKLPLIPPVLAAIAVLGAPAAGTANPTNVEVRLEDTSTGGDIHGMRMAAEPPEVRAGKVTFHATNRSKALVHEMLVVKVKRFGESLPYDAKTAEVIERRTDKLGEVPDLGPGTSGTLSLRLAPGDYLLLCNQPGHFKSGMWTKFTVSR